MHQQIRALTREAGEPVPVGRPNLVGVDAARAVQ
jgi:hypothetical protein